MFEQIYNFRQLSGNLFSGGMPKAEQLIDALNHGIQVVINLAPQDEEGALSNEMELVNSLGMNYINIPVLWDNPTRNNLEDFFKAMDTHGESNILVHCQANYRATCFITLYWINRLGWEIETAFEDLRKIWNPADYPIWEKFIEENLPLE